MKLSAVFVYSEFESDFNTDFNVEQLLMILNSHSYVLYPTNVQTNFAEDVWR
jgi:hypothetical protein